QGLSEWVSTHGVDLKIADPRRVVLPLAAGIGRAGLVDDQNIVVTVGPRADMLLVDLEHLPAVQDDAGLRIRLEESGRPLLRVARNDRSPLREILAWLGWQAGDPGIRRPGRVSARVLQGILAKVPGIPGRVLRMKGELLLRELAGVEIPIPQH